MKFSIQNSTLELTSGQVNPSHLNVVFAFNSRLLNNAAINFGSTSIGKYFDLSEAGTIELSHIENKGLIVLSLGDEKNLTLTKYLKALKSLANFLSNNKKISKINLVLEEQISRVLTITPEEYSEKTIFSLLNGLYYFDDFKSQKKELALQNINVVTKENIDKVLANATSILEGVILLKNLANNPANVVTPSYLAATAEKFAALSDKVSVEVLDTPALEQLKMNAFLGVARGSVEAAKFIKMEYRGASDSKKKPIVLVGKGITFDSGGISIKPSTNMNEMKYDMCGAATVMGTFVAAVKLALPINLVVLVPSCENLPSGSALKPGDILTTMSGQTVEVLNTDAEGRLILCDALTYAKQYDPELVIDVATLTGACVIALGSVCTGMYSNDEKLAEALQNASVRSNDRIWRLPLAEEYHDQLKSPIADMANIGGWGGQAGSVTAACFLEKFVAYKWAHLDIAGTAGFKNFSGSDDVGATGRPLYLLIDFLRHQA